jgi:hypothetical protein
MGTIVANLVSDLGLDQLPIDKQQQLLDRIGTIIYQRVLMRSYDVLTEAQKDELDAKLAAAAPDKNADVLFGYLGAAIPNFEGIVDDEVAHFKQESLELFKSLG